MAFWTPVWHGLRALSKQRALAAAALLLLAPSVGLAVGVFSVVDGFLFRPLPYEHAGQLLLIQEQSRDTGQAYGTLATLDFLRVRQAPAVAQATAFGRVAIKTLQSSDQFLEVRVAEVDIAFLGTLGIKPVVGHGFQADQPEGTVAVLTHQFWTSHYAADLGAIGQVLSIGEAPMEIVGVLPRAFVYPSFGRGGQPDILVYRSPANAKETSARSRVTAIVRLHPGTYRRTAGDEFDAIAQLVRQDYPELDPQTTIRAVPVLKGMFELYYPIFWVFIGSAACVLVATGASLGLVLVDQSLRRRHEYRVKMSLGARRRDIVIESATGILAIGLASGLVAVLAVRIAFAQILSLLPSPIYSVMADGVNWRAFVVAVCVALLVAIFASVGPTIWLIRQDLASSRETSRVPLRSARTITHVFLACQTAIAVVLVGTSTMLLGYLTQNRIQSLGITPSDAFVIQFDLRSLGPRDLSTQYRTYLAALAWLHQSPWIEAAGAGSAVPLIETGIQRDVQVSGSSHTAALHHVTHGYFAALGVQTIQGRDFEVGEEASQVIAATLVNARFAAQMWPGEDPIGRRIDVEDVGSVTVIGVVDDVRLAFGQAVMPTLYVPVSEESFRGLTIVARVREDAPNAVGKELQNLLTAFGQTPVILDTFEQLAERPLAYPRFQAVLFSLLGMVTLAISIGGVFSVTSRAIAVRFHELAIRSALGASPRQLVRLILYREGGALLVGMGAGVFVYTRTEPLLWRLLPDASHVVTWPFMLLGVGLVISSTVCAMAVACRQLREDRTSVLLRST